MAEGHRTLTAVPSAPPRPAESAPGTRIGRYLVKARLGGGGTVYGARDAELGREVALKIPGGDSLLLQGKALARVSYPNVVAV